MAKIINISDKLSLEKPVIQVGEKTYPVNDSLEAVLKFEEQHSEGDVLGMVECMKVALGEDACEEMGFMKMSFKNIQVWFFAVMAAMQDITYEEVEARFHKFTATDNE
jgi:aldehyde:ferredoxin oxidoreductase